MRRLLCRVLMLLSVLVLAGSRLASGGDFRVETRVFSGTDASPVSQNTTFFHGGAIYDFLNAPNEITVFDKQRGQIVLLDPTRRVKAELKTEELLDFNAQLRTWATGQTDPLLKFGAAPQFEEEVSEADSELIFKSALMTYRVQTAKAPSAEAALQFREFTDLYARLNAVTNPGANPPFPRLAVNEALHKRELIPEVVRLTLEPRHRFRGKTISLRSEHSVQWRLIDSDLRRINEAGEFLVKFPRVGLQQYLRLSTDQARR